MNFKSPISGAIERVKRDSPRCHELFKAGWKDVTPQATPAQIKQRKLWLRSGQLTQTASQLNQVLYHSELAWTVADKSILQQAARILADKSKRIKAKDF